MYYILIIIAIISAITIFTGCSTFLRKPVNTGGTDPLVKVSQGAPEITELSKEEIKTLLKKLASSPTPANLQPGAMCYEMAEPPDRAEYTCPECGRKTLYARRNSGEKGTRETDWSGISDIQWEIQACRRLMEKITKIHARLDESQYCSFCNPDAQHPQLGLVIIYPDSDKPHSVYGISADDLNMIIEFLDGKTKHVYSNDMEVPLKEEIQRLQTLLGVSP